jgi:hypothetical protein
VIRCINELFLISLSPPDIVVCAIWALKVDWSDINLSERWQLFREEEIRGYDTVIISDEPVDLDRILDCSRGHPHSVIAAGAIHTQHPSYNSLRQISRAPLSAY